MSSRNELEIDNPLGTPRWPVGRIVAGVLFATALLVNLALTGVIDSSMGSGNEENVISAMMGLLAAQFAGILILAGLVGPSWIRGQILGIVAGMLGFMAMAAGTRLVSEDSMGDIPWSAIGMFPWFVFSASFPLLLLRQIGWRLSDRAPSRKLREPPRIAELFHFTAVAAATLTIARLPQIQMEVEPSDFWVPLIIATLMFMTSSTLFLPVAVYFSFGTCSRTVSVLGLTILAIICYAAIFITCQLTIGFHVAWSVRMKVVTPVVVAVSVFLGLVYPSLGILARCGVRLRRGKNGQTIETAEPSASITSQHGVVSWSLRHVELLLIVAVAIGVNIYCARLETWRRARDQEIERLRSIAQTLGGNLWDDDREITGVTLQEGATDSHVQDFARHKTMLYAHIESTKITDRSLEWLGQVGTLGTLNLRKSAITDDGLKALSPLLNLRTLDLSHTSITGRGLSALTVTCPIDNLTLDGTNFSDSHISVLDRFPLLNQLSLDDTAVTDDGLRLLTVLSKLSQIHLERTAIDGRGLRNLRQANVVNVAGCKRITDESLQHIAELKAVTILTLKDTAVTDAGLTQLRRIPTLSFLNLSGTSVTDAGVAQLSDLTSLHGIRLKKTSVTGKCFANWKPGNLQQLYLNDSPVDDSVLPTLAALNLDLLHLGGTRVTVQGLLNAGFGVVTILTYEGQFSAAEQQQLDRAGIVCRNAKETPEDTTPW